MSTASWKAALAADIPEHLAQEIDAYEMELELRSTGRIDERMFAEARLRRGVYGQRYDNGRRHDGRRARSLAYPSGELLKGPDTLWDAPGMQRIKVPFGVLTAAQMERLAEVAEDYSNGLLHVTTRQDLQLHFVAIDDTPDLMRRLAAVGITTREACGNTVRNVTACPLAGVCHTEAFDVTSHARALAYFLLGHPDAQDFGRKFKVAFSGCRDQACGVAAFHDLGFIARVREEGGVMRRGFELWVGGGLGPVPHQAKPFTTFLPEEEVLPVAQAACRVFARLGEKHNRARARLKFLVAGLGIDEFRRLVLEERAGLPDDPRWTAHLGDATSVDALRRSGSTATGNRDARAGYEDWTRSNVHPQRQRGWFTATVALPLGDISSAQMRGLAALARTYADGDARTTVEQNIVLRWVPEERLPELHAGLLDLGLADAGAGTIVDVVSCPGTDTCKLGIAASRGLAGRLRQTLAASDLAADDAVRDLHIKVSGCFNSCGQHHVADLGFYGVSRKLDGRTVPHFQVVLGGQWEENAGAFGLAIGAVPSKRIPEVVERLAGWYRAERQGAERFREFVQRTGKARIRTRLEDLMAIPAYEAEPELYADWGDPRVFTVSDIGVGECAGEVVSRIDFDLAAGERRAFEAQLRLDDSDAAQATRLAHAAMLDAARALLRFIGAELPEVPAGASQSHTTGAHGLAAAATVWSSPSSSPSLRVDDADAVVAAFRTHLHDTELFHDPYARGKFAGYLFALHRSDPATATADSARAHVEEAQLFIEASHACHARLLEATAREA
jgi:sulfite reductase (ferredoxin)